MQKKEVPLMWGPLQKGGYLFEKEVIYSKSNIYAIP
jgi:hypothetical protein